MARRGCDAQSPTPTKRSLGDAIPPAKSVHDAAVGRFQPEEQQFTLLHGLLPAAQALALAERHLVLQARFPAGDPRKILQRRTLDLAKIENDVSRQEPVTAKVFDALKDDRPELLSGGFNGEGDRTVAGNLDPAKFPVVDIGQNDCHRRLSWSLGAE